MVLESWNVNLLDGPLTLNFVVSLDESLTVGPRKNGCIEAVMMIQVIRSSPLSPPPSKPSDLSLHKMASEFIVDFLWRDTKV